ncbi:hypothetical protein AB0903_28105 [Streptomyces sp. NPDC048389]|uniref:hypothetical protein n=1 Tax=Streptomyces sp. NPDC048389 TaxID=3154622 RepID=UPI0034530ACB
MSRRNSIADLDDDDLLEEEGGEGGAPVGPQHVPAVPEPVVIAQGRPRPALRLADLPEPEEVDASGPLSAEEEDLYSLCMRGVEEFKTAWWVLGKSMANMNSRHLYRKTHPTFEAWVRDTLGKSRATAYEEMTAYVVGELVSARADKAFEDNSNDVSARADIPFIGKKAASALNGITKDYGAEMSVAVIETIEDATGKKVPVKALTGIVQQLPRKEEKVLTEEELTALARELAASQAGKPQSAEGAPNGKDESPSASPALAGLRTAVSQLEAAHRALAPAKVKLALEEAPEEAARLLAEAEDMSTKATNRARQR